MDTSVALVQAYLHVNGYFTVAEYPVLEAYGGDHARTVTDLDILAFRFPGAGHGIIRNRRRHHDVDRGTGTDAVLRCPTDRPDMIVGEVKEGAARFNPATRDPLVLEIALARFGCCHTTQAGALVRSLLSRGIVDTPVGHSVRMVAFGSVPEPDPAAHWHTISMHHVVAFLRGYLREYWPVLKHAQVKDPVLSVLALLEKWERND